MNCVNCDGFAWWDGDFCCVTKMKILSYCDENQMPLQKENLTKERDCDEFEQVENKRQLEINYGLIGDVWHDS